MGSNSPPGKRVGPAAVGSPTGCKKASWKTSRKPGAEDGGQTCPPPLKLQNRYQVLAKGDSEEETRDGECPTASAGESTGLRSSPPRWSRKTNQTDPPPSVSTGQSFPVVGKRPAASQGRSEPTHVGETTGQSRLPISRNRHQLTMVRSLVWMSQ